MNCGTLNGWSHSLDLVLMHDLYACKHLLKLFQYYVDACILYMKHTHLNAYIKSKSKIF